MKFQEYEKYKNSNIDWLLLVPKEWKIKRLKDLGSLQNGVSQGADYFGKGNPFVDYSNVYNDTINISNIKNLANSTISDQKVYSVKENDVFFTRTSESVEEIGFSGICLKTIPKAVFSGFTIRLRANPKLITKEFSKYYFKAQSNRNFFIREMNIVTRASLSQGLLNKFPILLPSKETQIKITNYLDKNIYIINKKISLLEKKKEKYKELKQTLINNKITKGLDKTIEIKDSEIDWVGKIPNHWETMRLKDIFDERVLKNRQKDNEPITKNILSVMKDVGVINHRDKGLVGNKMSEDITNYKVVYVDDIVVNKMNVMIGSVGISKEFGALSVIYIILKTKKFASPKYYDYLFKIKRFQRNLRRISTGILEIREAVNMVLFNGQSLPVPPKDEQIEIVKYLDEKTKKIDEIIETIDKSVQTLKEFRKTLINDAVTGKIKIA